MLIQYRGISFDWRKRTATVDLNPAIPWSIEVVGGMQQVEADLRRVPVSRLELTGGMERWLYRIVRKHGGRQRERYASPFPFFSSLGFRQFPGARLCLGALAFLLGLGLRQQGAGPDLTVVCPVTPERVGTTTVGASIGLTTADVSDLYNCLVTNLTDGCQHASENAILGVYTPVSITDPPDSVTAWTVR